MGRGNAVSREIVESVARKDGCSPADLDPPLSAVIDPDALESIFDPMGEHAHGYGIVEFVYRGYLVTVGDEDEVTVREIATGGPKGDSTR